MQFTKRILLAFLATFAFISNSFASHVPGGNITYVCVGPNQFEITLTLFEDCGTAFEANGTQFISVANDCGFAAPTSITINNVIYQQEVSQLCPAQMGQSECSGGTLPGVWMHQWTGIITLPAGCDSWTFSYTSCCRNTSVNSPNQDSYYWETVLNSTTAPCNNSAQITSQPIPYVCANQLVNFNMAAVDPDGNTLVFSLIPALTSATTSITYNVPYTGASPINGITINPATGQISFTPTILGNFIVAVLVEEFDVNGNLVGSVIQDFQFEVITCTNQVPSNPAGGITNFSGGGVQTGPSSLQACEGDSFCFNLTFTDSDPANILSVTSNVQQSFPGATVTITGTNPVNAQVCITIPSGAPATSILSFDVEDDACPIPGINSFPITLSVITSTYAGANEIICLNQGVQLTANGGSNFVWSVISGPPMIIGTNFSCNNCQSPFANPSATTSYQVVSNLAGGCNNIDTITVTVVPDFTYNITQSSGTSCLQDPVTLSVTTTPGGAFTFNWDGTTNTADGFLSTTSGATTVITASQPGTYSYVLTITSPGGCIKVDTVSLVVAPTYAPQVTAMVDSTSIWCGDVVNLSVDLGGGVPATCGLSTSGGCGTTTPSAVGLQTGVNDGYTYPSPYAHWYANAKQQYLFTAAELTAMGFVGGKISAISWQTTAQNSAQASFHNYTISIGCTGTTSLSSTTWETGLSVVYGPVDYTVLMGNNTHNFTTAYEWDGVSNLVVEVCFDWWTQYSYTYNWSTPYTTTAFNSTSYFNSDGSAACPSTNPWIAIQQRPVTTFHTCPSIPDPNDYTYLWTPSGSVSNPTAQNSPATPPTSTLYTVTVTNINGGCSDTSSVFVNVDCNTCYPADPTITNVSCNGGNDGSIIATMVGTTGPWTVDWFNAGGTLLQSTPNVTTTDQLNNLIAGSYTITITDSAGCTKDTVITITQPAILVANAGNDAVICINGTANLLASATGGAAPYTFMWDNAVATAANNVTPAANTCYVVTITDANGCIDQDTVCVFLNPPLLVSVSPNDTVCPGETATITANAVGGNGGPYTYVWDLNGVNVGTGASINVIPPTNGAQYCVTVTDNCGTPAANNCTTIFLHAVPAPLLSADNLGSCIPLVTNFTNLTNAADVSSVVWDFGDGSISTTGGVVSHTYTSAGCYDVTLTVTSPNGCTSDTTYLSYVCAWPIPVADFEFGPQPTNLFAPDITFINTSSSDATTFFYDFAGLGTSTLPNPSFTFPNDNPGNYDVTLAVSNNYGCVDTITKTVVINGIYTMYAPNSFTPNGDGKNDVFMIQGEGYDPNNFEFFIFNRWGELLFTSNSMSSGWDGTFRGQAVKGDVYVWRVKSKDIWSNDAFETNGHVTLIRGE